MEISVKVADAINQLVDNRLKHLEDYDLQLAAWKMEYEKYKDERDAWVNSTKFDISKEPKAPLKPINHAEDYDKLIDKLTWHADSFITLSDREYSTIFEDEFGWKYAYINSATIAAGSIVAGSINADMIGGNVVQNAEKRLAELGYKKVSENE